MKTVVKNVGALAHSYVDLKAGEEDQIAENIFSKIRGKENTLGIQLPYLQVFLDKLYLQITQDRSRTADATFSLDALEKMGDIGDVLRNFLDEQVLSISQNLHQPSETLWKVISAFVILEGTKEPMSEEDLGYRLPDISPDLPRQILEAFENSRILRFTEIEQLFEITHDSLAKQVHAKRSDEEIALLEARRLIKSQLALNPETRAFFTKEQLQLIEPYALKLNLNREETAHFEASQYHVQKIAEEERQRSEKELALNANILIDEENLDSYQAALDLAFKAVNNLEKNGLYDEEVYKTFGKAVEKTTLLS